MLLQQQKTNIYRFYWWNRNLRFRFKETRQIQSKSYFSWFSIAESVRQDASKITSKEIHKKHKNNLSITEGKPIAEMK